MVTQSITIDVDPETARAYAGKSEQDRRKLQLLLRLRLHELLTSPARPLGEVMDELSRKAEKRGLTPSILESLLHDK
jgi:hypothetical protein